MGALLPVFPFLPWCACGSGIGSVWTHQTTWPFPIALESSLYGPYHLPFFKNIGLLTTGFLLTTQLFSPNHVSSGHVEMLLLSLLNIAVISTVHFFTIWLPWSPIQEIFPITFFQYLFIFAWLVTSTSTAVWYWYLTPLCMFFFSQILNDRPYNVSYKICDFIQNSRHFTF